MTLEHARAWIERIPHHIQEIIRLKGGNEYRKAERRVLIDQIPSGMLIEML